MCEEFLSEHFPSEHFTFCVICCTSAVSRPFIVVALLSHSLFFLLAFNATEFLSNMQCPISWIDLINTAHFREIIIPFYVALQADNKVLLPLKKNKKKKCLFGIVLGTQWVERFTVQLWWEPRPQQMGQKLTVTQRRKTTKSRGENGDIREIHHHPLLLTLCRPWPYQAAGLSEWRHQLVGRAARPDLVWEHEQPRLQQSSW